MSQHLTHVLLSRRLTALFLEGNITAQQSELFFQQKGNLKDLGNRNCRNGYIFNLRTSFRATSYDRTEHSTIGKTTGLDLTHLKQLHEIITRVKLDF
jgi:hypothetical protein